MYLHENPDEMSQLVTDAATYFSRAEAYVEKDYYATMVLREVTSRSPKLVFKGGTCLSKCHHVIERFSEDVDLGMAEDVVTESMRKALKQAVVESAAALGVEILNLGETRSRREYNRYDLAIPNNHANDKLIVETAVITPAAPVVRRCIQSFIGEYCEAVGLRDIIREYGLEPFELTASSMERTFCDKAFALCDYYLANEPIPPRQSRHIYDLRKLQDRVVFAEDLASLFATVRHQRSGKNRCLSAGRDIDVAAVLLELAKNNAYKQDYLAMTSNLLYEEMPYEEAVKALGAIADFLGGVDWDIGTPGQTPAT